MFIDFKNNFSYIVTVSGNFLQESSCPVSSLARGYQGLLCLNF